MSFRIGFFHASPEAVEIFESRGLTVTPLEAAWNDDAAAVRALKNMDCWVNSGQNCTANMIDELSDSLKMICRSGIGFDQIDIAAATAHGVCVTNTAGSMNDSVSETALILILESMRRTYLFNRRFMNGGNFDRSGIVGHGLEGKTVGLLGFGGIARNLARYLSGFRCRLIVYDIFRDEQAAKALNAEYVSLEELAAQSDVISVHCPLTEQTRHLVNGDFLRRMKHSAILVNTARGPIVDEKALISALREGGIAGAGLDVYEKEPVDPSNELLTMSNVYALPHVGWHTVESARKTLEQAADNVADFVAGKVPRNCLNPQYLNHK